MTDKNTVPLNFETKNFWTTAVSREAPAKLDPRGESSALKYDANKTDWCILPFEALEEVVKVLEFGAKKYDRGNYASGNGLNYSRVINSLIRHTLAFSRGEDIDPESGLSHIAHAGANVLFLLHYEKNRSKFSNDDRAEKIIG